MKKGQLKALFIEAKGTGQKYIGVMIQTEGSSEPEVIINPKENFNAKFDYYMAAYDDDLILIATKGKKDIRITQDAPIALHTGRSLIVLDGAQRPVA